MQITLPDSKHLAVSERDISLSSQQWQTSQASVSIAPLSTTAVPAERQTTTEQETSAFWQPRAALIRLENYFIADNQLEVLRFLDKYDFLTEIICEAYLHISEVFGAGVLLYLELEQEYDEDFQELFVVIKSPYDVTTARRLMGQLRRDWFLEAMNRTQGKLNITEEPL